MEDKWLKKQGKIKSRIPVILLSVIFGISSIVGLGSSIKKDRERREEIIEDNFMNKHNPIDEAKQLYIIGYNEINGTSFTGENVKISYDNNFNILHFLSLLSGNCRIEYCDDNTNGGNYVLTIEVYGDNGEKDNSERVTKFLGKYTNAFNVDEKVDSEEEYIACKYADIMILAYKLGNSNPKDYEKIEKEEKNFKKALEDFFKHTSTDELEKIAKEVTQAIETRENEPSTESWMDELLVRNDVSPNDYWKRKEDWKLTQSDAKEARKYHIKNNDEGTCR